MFDVKTDSCVISNKEKEKNTLHRGRHQSCVINVMSLPPRHSDDNPAVCLITTRIHTTIAK